MGTNSSLLQLLEEGLTSAFLPDLLGAAACPPTTIMLTWESNCVVVAWPSSFPTLAVDTQTTDIAPLKYLFGTAADSPQADDHIKERKKVHVFGVGETHHRAGQGRPMLARMRRSAWKRSSR